MDPKAQMPDIKSEVNKVDDGNKKKSAGLLGTLFGGGGSGAGGLGALGAGAAGGGGMLATKAGVMALVLMGSAVAGGIGLAGYKMFGPSEADKAAGGNFSLFTPKPVETADPNAVAPVAADGSSASLNYMAAAAAKDKAADASASASADAAAPTDNTAASGAKAAADAEAAARASAGGTTGPINSGGGNGAVGSHGLANVKKLGALSGAAGGGGGSSVTAGSSARLGDNIANASKNGASSAFSRQGGGAAKTSSSAGRSVAAKRGRALGDARNVLGNQAGGKASSSFAAGRTYDGSATHNGGAIGPDGSAIGMDGAGDGASAQPKSLPANSAPNMRKQDTIPEPPAKEVTPWAKHIMGGMALGAIAIAAMMWASSIATAAKEAYLKVLATAGVTAAAILVAKGILETAMMNVRLLIGAGIAMALAGAMLGGMISGGKNGQTLQGGLLIASSLAIAAAGGMLMAGTFVDIPKDAKSAEADAKFAAFGTPSTWMYVIGGMGAVGLVGTMMVPKKTCIEGQDGCHAYIQQQINPTNYTV